MNGHVRAQMFCNNHIKTWDMCMLILVTTNIFFVWRQEVPWMCLFYCSSSNTFFPQLFYLSGYAHISFTSTLFLISSSSLSLICVIVITPSKIIITFSLLLVFFHLIPSCSHLIYLIRSLRSLTSYHVTLLFLSTLSSDTFRPLLQ